MIDFDVTRLPMGVPAWTAFLNAVEAADPADESEWIEWKVTLDLRTHRDLAKIAIFIVAAANRDPDVSSRWMGGTGILIIGLEPGVVRGVKQRDPAELDDEIGRLLGPQPPAWEPRPMTYKGKPLLIITVAPPNAGDPIYTMERQTDLCGPGQVYVRRKGRSERANANDIRRLSRRLTSDRGPGLDISVDCDVGDGLPSMLFEQARVEGWLAKERDTLLQPLLEQERKEARQQRQPSSLLGLMGQAERAADIARAATTSFVEQETRTPNQFRQQVDRYISGCAAAMDDALKAIASHCLSPLSFYARNHTDKNFASLVVEVHVEGNVEGYRHRGYQASLAEYLPDRPRRWGPREKDFSAISSFVPRAPAPVMSTRPEIRNGGSTTIKFPPIDLRPRSTAELGNEVVLVVTESEATTLIGNWTATATNVDGQSTGLFHILVKGRLNVLQMLAETG